MVTGFRDGHSLFSPVNDRVCGMESEESKNDVFSATAHDVEEMFLSNPFNVGIEGASVMDCTSFVCSLIHITNNDGRGKFLGEELVFSDKLPVDAGDICTRVY